MVSSAISDDSITEIRNLPSLKTASPICNIPHPTDLDADLHFPFENNFDYYTIDDFNNSDTIKDSLSRKAFTALHCNIRSLSANYDNLHHLLEETNCSFSLIGLSETKFVKNKENFVNVNIMGYNFIHEPTLSNAGGVGFYIRNDIKFSFRNDLSTSTSDFETLWIEISQLGQPNLICSVIYRHPNSSLDNFIETLHPILDKVHQEKSYVFLWVILM